MSEAIRALVEAGVDDVPALARALAGDRPASRADVELVRRRVLVEERSGRLVRLPRLRAALGGAGGSEPTRYSVAG